MTVSKNECVALDLPGHGFNAQTECSWSDLWHCVALTIEEYVGVYDICIVLHSFAATMLPEILDANYDIKKIYLVEGIISLEDITWSINIIHKSELQYDIWFKQFQKQHEIILRSQLVNKHDSVKVRNWSRGFNLVNKTVLLQIARQLHKRLNSGKILKLLLHNRDKVTYIKGDHSNVSDKSLIALVKSNIHITEIKNSGHFPMIDNPSVLWNALVNDKVF